MQGVKMDLDGSELILKVELKEEEEHSDSKRFAFASGFIENPFSGELLEISLEITRV